METRNERTEGSRISRVSTLNLSVRMVCVLLSFPFFLSFFLPFFLPSFLPSSRPFRPSFLFSSAPYSEQSLDITCHNHRPNRPSFVLEGGLTKISYRINKKKQTPRNSKPISKNTSPAGGSVARPWTISASCRGVGKSRSALGPRSTVGNGSRRSPRRILFRREGGGGAKRGGGYAEKERRGWFWDTGYFVFTLAVVTGWGGWKGPCQLLETGFLGNGMAHGAVDGLDDTCPFRFGSVAVFCNSKAAPVPSSFPRSDRSNAPPASTVVVVRVSLL